MTKRARHCNSFRSIFKGFGLVELDLAKGGFWHNWLQGWKVQFPLGHPRLMYALVVLEGRFGYKNYHQSLFLWRLAPKETHLRSTTKNLSLLALFCVHSHQRLKPFSLLHLLCYGGFPVLSLTACYQQHAHSYLFPGLSLCLSYLFLFLLHLLSMCLAASFHSVYFLSPFAQFSLPLSSSHMSCLSLFHPHFSDLLCFFVRFFFSSCLFLCPRVQIF